MAMKSSIFPQGSSTAALPGTGTVTSVSVTTVNGVSGSVATATTTPAISLTLGAITPSSVVATGSIRSNTSVILEETGAGTDTITLQAPASIAASYALTLPVDDGAASDFLQTDGSGVLSWVAGSGSGTVTSVAVTTANGVSGSVATATTTPDITLILGAITPTSIVASGTIQSDTGVILKETAAGADTITLQAPAALAAPYTLTLPVDDGGASEFLQTDGSGVLSWAAGGGSAAFSAITSGTNTAAAMVVDTGASVAFTGTSTLATATTVVSEFSGQTNISGPDATTNVEIGSVTNDANAGTGGTSVVIGNSASNSANRTGAVVIGSGATNASGGNSSVVIGIGANTTSVGSGESVAIGSTASAAALSIAIGSGSTASANTFVAGSARNIDNVYFGKGITSTTATAYTINGTGGSGADNAGGGLTLAGGKATGNAAGGSILFQTSTVAASSSTPQTLATRLTISSTTITPTVSVTLSNNIPLELGGGQASLSMVSVLTPDAPAIWTGALSNSLHLNERADFNFDFNNGLAGTVAATNPGFIIHGAAQNTTEFNHLNMYGSHGGNVTTLTDNTATTFFHTPALTAGQIYAGNGSYTVKVLDAADETQVASGNFEWYVMRGNTGGTVAGIQQIGNDGVLPGLPLKATSSGTLTVALSVAVASEIASFQMTADTSLTPTTFNMTTQMNVRTGPAEIIVD